MFTYLTNDEKLDSLIYMEKFISKDETIAEIQYGVIERVLDLIIKECNYAYQGVDKDGEIYYLDWIGEELTPEYCERRIGYIKERSEKYKSIYTAPKEDLKKTTSHDILLVTIKGDYLNNFQFYLYDSWYDYTVEEMIEFKR